MYALVIWCLYILAMQCLQIHGYFICKYFGDIMQYGGICFIYILNILIILSNNHWIKLGCVYMEPSSYWDVFWDYLNSGSQSANLLSANISPAAGVPTGWVTCKRHGNIYLWKPIVSKPTHLNPSGWENRQQNH
jgi:hypothetical protein